MIKHEKTKREPQLIYREMFFLLRLMTSNDSQTLMKHVLRVFVINLIHS